MKKTVNILLLLFFMGSCTKSELGQAPIPENYHDVVEAWRQDRIETLKQPIGWLRLAGMEWLEEGENSFGSGKVADIRFPGDILPDFAGTFVLENGVVTMNVADGVEITHNGEPVIELVMDGEDKTAVDYGTLHWFVISRGDMVAIRFYNRDNPQADAFEGFPAYPINPEWRRQARFHPSPQGTTIPVVNVLGQQVDAPTPGTIEFTLNGKRHTLLALEGSDRMFIIVADETNRTETYQAGRYIYIDYPMEGNDYTVIDFNKLYNPPCAYNLFTTCQLPPVENRLNTSITAGEKRPVNWVGLDIDP
ncbi:MAG: DUF1684 domain-containing protein [Balneolaceae bacterium]|nr:MAG: DUF1684 domain-containing protein [Balneolaceae bacterium]